jgi:hypothetical protein
VKSAIDISTATFTEFQAWGVPGELFKVNGVDQFVVDFNATESFLRSQSIPNDGPLTMLQLIHDRRRDFRYNYVHVIPRTRSDGLLECWNAIADILRTHDLLTTPDHS